MLIKNQFDIITDIQSSHICICHYKKNEEKRTNRSHIMKKYGKKNSRKKDNKQEEESASKHEKMRSHFLMKIFSFLSIHNIFRVLVQCLYILYYIY